MTSDPALYVDDEVVFRQFCCPGCWTAVHSSIVPAAHEDHVLELSRLHAAAPAGGPRQPAARAPAATPGHGLLLVRARPPGLHEDPPPGPGRRIR